MALDPTSAIRLNVLGYILLLNDRPRESIAQLEVAIVHGADFPMPYENLSRAHLYLRNFDESEMWNREEYIPRLGFDPDTYAMWDRAAATRYQAFRTGDQGAYQRCCAGIGPPSDHLLLGDTARAIEAFAERYRGRPRFNVNALNPLWRPEMDAVRDDPRFQAVFDEVLAHAGLEGAVLSRDSGE